MRIFKPLILPFIVGIPGVCLTILGASDLSYAKQSASWPRARGTIIESYASHSSKTGSAVVRYAYTVGGVAYRGDRLSYSQSVKRFYGHPSNLEASFYKGADISIYYDPKLPSKSVLIPGHKNHSIDDYSAIISGVFMLGISVALGRIIFIRGQLWSSDPQK